MIWWIFSYEYISMNFALLDLINFFLQIYFHEFCTNVFWETSYKFHTTFMPRNVFQTNGISSSLRQSGLPLPLRQASRKNSECTPKTLLLFGGHSLCFCLLAWGGEGAHSAWVKNFFLPISLKCISWHNGGTHYSK